MVAILDFLDNTCTTFAGKTAFIYGQEQVTFEEVRTRAKQIGTFLAGVVPQRTPVVVCAEKSVNIPALYLGILYAGCYYVPVAKDLPPARQKLILETTGAPFMLTDTDATALKATLGFEGQAAAYPCIGQHIDEALIKKRRDATIDTDPMYVIFTSGSTGKPKGVVAPHCAVVDYITVFTKTFGITSEDIFGNQAPLDYIAAIRDVYLPVYTGATTVMIPKQHFSLPLQLFDLLNQYKITTLCWVSAALSLCSEFNVFNQNVPQYVNKVFFTGAVMPCKHLKIWQQHLPNALFVNHYGPTEITASCTYYIVNHPVEDGEQLPIGIPFDNTEILLLNEDGTATAPGEKGEICVRGTSLALGYYKNPEKTDEAFIINPLNGIYKERIYKTGDIGALRPDGILTFHGRKDFQIKHMGHRIELGEIEAAAGLLPGVGKCCCMYNAETELIYLYYTGTADRKAITAALRETLPAFMLPRKFVPLEEIPLNIGGKPDIAALRALF